METIEIVKSSILGMKELRLNECNEMKRMKATTEFLKCVGVGVRQ